MRKIIILLATFSIAFSQDLTYYVLKVNSNMKKLSEANAKEATPYLYGKVKGYEEGLKIYAKYGNERGVERAYELLQYNAETALRGAYTNREPYTELIVFKPKEIYVYYEDDVTGQLYYTEKKKEKQEFLDLVAYEDLQRRIEFLKNSNAKSCAPFYYGKSEALFNLISYELSREEPNRKILVDLKEALEKNLVLAEELLRYAMNKELECYAKK